jgi:hypothetical protein
MIRTPIVKMCQKDDEDWDPEGSEPDLGFRVIMFLLLEHPFGRTVPFEFHILRELPLRQASTSDCSMGGADGRLGETSLPQDESSLAAH